MAEVKVNGRKLKELREASRLTQGQLEVKAKVAQGHISRLESGERTNAKLSTIGRLASALGVTIGELVEGPLPEDELLPTRAFLRQKYGVDEPTARQIEEVIETLLHLRKVREDHEEKE